MKDGSPQPRPAGDDEGRAPAPCIRSEDLLARHRRIYILHDGRRYALTLTRKNRLILTLDAPAGEIAQPAADAGSDDPAGEDRS